MRAFRIAAILALAAAAGCATTQLERRFDEGRYQDVASLFDSDPHLWADEGAVYRAIIARVLPESPAYAPVRARTDIRRYLQLFPDAKHAPEARHLSQLVGEVLRLDTAGSACASTAGRLVADTAELHARLDSLTRVVAVQREQFDSLRTATQAEARQRDVQIRGLQDELDRLKAIDLGSPRRPPHAAPPDTTAPGRS